MKTFVDTQGITRCAACRLTLDLCTCDRGHPARVLLARFFELPDPRRALSSTARW